MTTTSGSPRSTRRLRRRVAVGALLVAAVGLASLSAASAAPAASKPSSTPAKAETARTETARTASAVFPAAPANCPTSTYPTGSTSKTGYGIAFTADILNGTLNAGYHETPNPAGDAYAPFGLHVGGLTGTICGLIEIPSLQLSATPSDIQVANYGEITGPQSLGPGDSGSYTFSGIADPGDNEVAFNVGGLNAVSTGTTPASQVTTAAAVAYYDTGKADQLSVSNVVLGSGNHPAGAPPGPTAKTEPLPTNGSLTLTNDSGQAVTNIAGEEPTGFINGPSTLAKGQSATYTYSAVGQDVGSQNIPLNFTGETKSGPVRGFGVAWYTVPGYNEPPMTISNLLINGSPASSAPGPAVTPGSVYTATYTLTNNSTSPPLSLYGLSYTTGCGLTPQALSCPYSGTNQYPTILALTGLAGNAPVGYEPFGVYGFNLAVDVPCTPGTSGADCPADLATTPNGVCGATDLLPPNYCLPANALSAKGVAAASSVFTTANPVINCDQSVAVNVTTGRSTVVPTQVTGADRRLSVWTMEGQGIVGPLVGAQGEVVGNDFGLTVTNKPTPEDPTPDCVPWDGVFDQIAGGVTPPNSPICHGSGQTYCYYNGNSPDTVGNSKKSCLNQPNPNIFCGPPGEVQLSAEVVVTSVDLPTYNPQTAGVKLARSSRRRLALSIGMVSLALAGCGSLTRNASAVHSTGRSAQKAILTSLFGALPTLAPPPQLPADCIPAASGIQIQLGAYATFSGTLSIDARTGGQMVAADITGTLCGKGIVINSPAPPLCPAGTPAAVELNIPADGETFNLQPADSVELTMVPGMTITVAHTQVNPTPISAVVCAGAAAPGPLEAPCYITPGHAPPCSPLEVTASASASLLGANCVLGVTVPVRGSIFGPLSGFTVNFANEPFSIDLPAPTTSCPTYVTNAVGSLLQFPLNSAGEYEPLTAGLAHINISGNGVAYYASS